VRERGKPFGFGRLRRSAGPYLQRLGEKVRIAQPGRSRRTIPTGPATCRLSDVVVTTGCHALAPSQLATLHPDCERFRGAGAPVRLGRARLGRHQPSRTAARHLAVCGDSEGCPSKPKCSSTPFIVSISQRAHASPRLLGNFWSPGVPRRGFRIRFLPHPFGVRQASSPSHGRCPRLAFARRHSRQRVRQAR
jgi:hypothetical protein